MKRFLALLSLGLFAVPAASQSPPPEEPSLAQIAEKNRKNKTGRPNKVLTNDDLKNAKGNVIVLPATVEAKDEASKNGDTSGALPIAASEIQGRIDELSGRIARLRKAMEEARRELDTGQPAADQRAALTKIVEENQRALSDAELMILGLEETARRQGVQVSRP